MISRVISWFGDRRERGRKGGVSTARSGKRSIDVLHSSLTYIAGYLPIAGGRNGEWRNIRSQCQAVVWLIQQSTTDSKLQ